MKMQWSLIAGLLFALLTAVFAVINVDPVDVNLLFGMVHVPLILLIIGCTLIGGIIVGSYGIYRQYQLQKEIKSLAGQLIHIQEVTGYTPDLTEEAETASQDQENIPQ
ncbi:lipopolysaccharide assembly protein LapA domain-containing protein [Paenibacillus sp. N3/727]|uniref:LapA family protein n=1 Tax=Paenibacillus sp. N3/727 TaxID=2925845 RepID=UPI001F52BD6B|nr:lipopolysaccharide assembly protein LapA domain-containing protein [Paenibacillus sp. N3/727]UNK17089.1 lipopolysaccharide assembly protein LapA domain-containing protein [Paenibacillus sp. N3/727]